MCFFPSLSTYCFVALSLCILGIVAALPFEVLGEYGQPTFQRGALHVYFQRCLISIFKPQREEIRDARAVN